MDVIPPLVAYRQTMVARKPRQRTFHHPPVPPQPLARVNPAPGEFISRWLGLPSPLYLYTYLLLSGGAALRGSETGQLEQPIMVGEDEERDQSYCLGRVVDGS